MDLYLFCRSEHYEMQFKLDTKRNRLNKSCEMYEKEKGKKERTEMKQKKILLIKLN